MIFSSIEFFAFLAILLVALAVIPRENVRRNLLLVSSYLFYGWWDWRFCSLLLFSTAVDYLIGLRLESASVPRQRKALLAASLVINLGLLGFFKYANFFLDSFARLTGSETLPASLHIILPVGISFFTFQTMSYSIDVYRRRLPATRNLRDFALFVSFFPQLVAGPIVRGSEFLPQLEEEHPLRRDNVITGTGIFLAGFIKKVLFADTLAVFVDPVFADPLIWSSATCWLALVGYAAQIYYDFSGYSQMAIGVGRMIGYDLPENFRHPYRSTSITEFWRRWHITLSTWLRDYLYIPLGGNRRGEARTWINLMVTMLLGGLWHGANWTFVVWGGLHGVGLAVHKLWSAWADEHMSGRLRSMLWPVSWAGTFLFVLLTWVFFRSPDFSTAREYLGQLVAPGRGMAWYNVQAIAVLLAGTVIHVCTVLRSDRDLEIDLRRPEIAALAVFAILFLLLFAPFQANPFIYFQF